MKFPKEISSEFFEYTTHLSLDELKTAIATLIERSKSQSLSVNLAGKITKENEFEITSKWEIGPFVSSPLSYIKINSPTSLRIFIYKNQNKTTQINLVVSPNSYFPSLFIICPILFILLLWLSGNVMEACLIILPSIFLCIFFILTLSKFSKRRLKNRFVKYFDLQETKQ